MQAKAPDAFRTISEVGEDLGLPQHVLRFWETRFSAIRPLKRAGGRRYYRPDDVDLIKGIQTLLYRQGYTIKGVQRIIKESGHKTVQAIGRGDSPGIPAREAGDDAPGEGEAPALASGGEREAIAPGPRAGTAERLQRALDGLLECERILGALNGDGSGWEPDEV